MAQLCISLAFTTNYRDQFTRLCAVNWEMSTLPALETQGHILGPKVIKQNDSRARISGGPINASQNCYVLLRHPGNV